MTTSPTTKQNTGCSRPGPRAGSRSHLSSEDHTPGPDTSSNELREFISTHLGVNSRHHWDLLLASDRVHNTHAALKQINQVLDKQARERRAEFQTFKDNAFKGVQADTEAYHAKRAEYYQWKVRHGNYRELLNKRLQEARAIVREVNLRQAAHDTGQSRYVARTLAGGIAAHRQACIDSGVLPEPHDTRLWELLDQLTLSFGSQQLTLTQAIARRSDNEQDGDQS